MGLQFHETVRGKIFFEHQLPSLIKSLNRFVDVFEMKEHHGIQDAPEGKRMIALYGKMQKIEGFKNLPCPRFGREMRPELADNSYSRHEPVYICSDCGTDEAFMDTQGNVMPPEEWFLTVSSKRSKKRCRAIRHRDT